MNFKGQPITKGAIRFVTHDKTPGTGAIGPITDGHYDVKTNGLLSGKYLVMISGFKETGKTLNIDGNEIKEEQQYVPAKFNTNTTEVVELSPGENVRDFDLMP